MTRPKTKAVRAWAITTENGITSGYWRYHIWRTKNLALANRPTSRYKIIRVEIREVKK